MLVRLAEMRSEIEWEYAMFQRRFAECDRDTGEDLALGVADAKEREAFVLLGTLRSYQKLEQRIFDDYRGPYQSLDGFQDVIQPMHKLWHNVYGRWQKLDPNADPAAAATPDWARYEEVLIIVGRGATPLELRELTRTSKAVWTP